MKTASVLAATVLGVASISLLAQQPAPGEPQTSSPPPPAAEQSQPSQQTPQATEAAPATSATTASAAAAMSPVTGELVDNLDSKTAKTGDSVVIKTKSNVKTADGTDIPKGSKLIGHITAVKPSGAENANSQVALQFDRAELKGGQSVPIHSELQSLAPSGSETPSGTPDTMAAAPAGGAPGGSMNNGSAAGSPSAQSPAQPQGSAQPQMSNGGAAPGNPNTGLTAGTVVARTGNIAIRTTSIPGVLLANNEPGQQDPRMAQSSGILLGAKRDIHLDGGTNVTIGVAAVAASTGGN
jgi:hypothetical protein